ncbi:MAG: type II toxin-antitoxin system YoeB family toxin [Angelakisella sp.]|nr:type II toxin-antitoxin system YoeB family toxin [Angelakisella sp.]
MQALSGYWSRRIDGANRLVYHISGASSDTIEVLSCRDHYSGR